MFILMVYIMNVFIIPVDHFNKHSNRTQHSSKFQYHWQLNTESTQPCFINNTNIYVLLLIDRLVTDITVYHILYTQAMCKNVKFQVIK